MCIGLLDSVEAGGLNAQTIVVPWIELAPTRDAHKETGDPARAPRVSKEAD